MLFSHCRILSTFLITNRKDVLVMRWWNTLLSDVSQARTLIWDPRIKIKNQIKLIIGKQCMNVKRSPCHGWGLKSSLTLVFDECHHYWWRLYNHQFNCPGNRRMSESWAAKSQCYDLCLCLLQHFLPSHSLYVTLTCCICPGSWGPPVSRPDVAPAKCPLTLDEFSATSHLQCPCHETETSHYVMSGDHIIDPGACHDTDHGLGLGPGVSQAHITSRLQGRVRTVAKIVLRIHLNTGGVSK